MAIKIFLKCKLELKIKKTQYSLVCPIDKQQNQINLIGIKDFRTVMDLRGGLDKCSHSTDQKNEA